MVVRGSAAASLFAAAREDHPVACKVVDPLCLWKTQTGFCQQRDDSLPGDVRIPSNPIGPCSWSLRGPGVSGESRSCRKPDTKVQ